MTEKTVRVSINGRVQGVWYRAWTEKTAAGHGLSGWVRNRPDGSVEALFSGPADAVDRMLSDCRDGPPLAQVTGMDIADADPPGVSGFKVLPDG
ncbi:MAG: acylphosphatase [Alphaproteobacteria bacterium]